MLKIAICDDEDACRKSLSHGLNLELSFLGIPNQIKEFDSGESLLAADGFTCDILFLDIEMGRLNGMDTAGILREKKELMVIIFVTSYPDYVFQGYEVGALNYILKPYDENKIIKVLHQAIKSIKDLKEQYYLLEQQSGSLKISFRELLYFYSERRQITAVTKDATHSFYKKLDDVEKEVPDFFVRIHNRYLVNMKFVSGLQGTKLHCQGKELPVSRRYQQQVAIAFARKILTRHETR